MFSITVFFRYSIESDNRVQEQRIVGTWAEVQAMFLKARDWANVRNVGQGAEIADIIVRVSKDGEKGYFWAEASSSSTDGTNGRGYFEPLSYYTS